jgi:hypothetical protein
MNPVRRKPAGSFRMNLRRHCVHSPDPSVVTAPARPRLVWRAALATSLVGLALLGGCSTLQPPQPWEKGTLARKDMTFEADSLDQRYVQHIYFSKEAASGGYGVGGGGCGCN